MGKIVNPKVRLRNRVDYYFKEYIKLRDEGKQCVSCEIIPTRKVTGQRGQNYLVACHYVRAGNYFWRWNPDNCHGGCVACNRRAEEHKRHYSLFMVRKHGLETIEAMDQHHLKLVDYSTQQLRELKDHWKLQCKELELEKQKLSKKL